MCEWWHMCQCDRALLYMPSWIDWAFLPSVRHGSKTRFVISEDLFLFYAKHSCTLARGVAKSQLPMISEISTERKYLRLILKVHGPKEPVGFINEPPEVFLSYVRPCLVIKFWRE